MIPNEELHDAIEELRLTDAPVGTSIYTVLMRLGIEPVVASEAMADIRNLMELQGERIIQVSLVRKMLYETAQMTLDKRQNKVWNELADAIGFDKVG